MASKKLNYLGFLALALFLFNCSKNTNTKLNGRIKGLSKGAVYLQQVQDSVLKTIDSVALLGSDQFTFDFNLNEPDVFMLYLDKKDGSEYNDRINLFLNPGEQEFYTDLEDFENAAKLSGSKNHIELVKFNKMISRFNIDNLWLDQLKYIAEKSGRQAFIDSTQVDFNNFLKRKYLYVVNFALKNKELEVAPYVTVKEIRDANKRYLDTVYKSLSKPVQKSKYGEQLKEIISE